MKKWEKEFLKAEAAYFAIDIGYNTLARDCFKSGFVCAWNLQQDKLAECLNKIDRLTADRDKLRNTLSDFVIPHEHKPDLPHTRAMGANYGWCDFCCERVTWEEDIALKAIEESKRWSGGRLFCACAKKA